MSKKSTGSVFVVVIVLIIAAVVASNFIGPSKGWVEKTMEEFRNKKHKVITTKDPDTIPKKPVVDPKIEIKDPVQKVEDVVVKAPEKSETEKLLEKLFEKYNKKYKDPIVGKKYLLHLKNGAKIAGVLKEYSEGKIVFKQQYGSVMYPLHNIHKKSYKTFFPKQMAKHMALKEFKELMSEQVKVKEVVEQVLVASASYKPEAYKSFAYDTSAAKTTELLKKVLSNFTNWVQVQQKRMGGKIATRVCAKKQGRHVALYMTVSDMFMQQGYDWRFVITEGMWRIWSMKCYDNNQVSSLTRAHIVLIDSKGRIVGGSTEKNASSIWAAKK